MNREQYKRVVKIFNEAADLQGTARSDFLDRECGDDPKLRSNVERLLSQDNSKALEEELGMGHKLLAMDTPSKIKCYHIIRRIGEGGMGAVYLAEQDQPKRRVALKMIRPGVFSEETFKRFKMEAELLGRLQHPGVAQIYEAGETENQPFFAMEYVKGLELRRYVKERRLGVRDRLKLMARVCDAVNHAHQKGIVHRDLKPDNILVTETNTEELGQPKVLDFGVARATDSDVQVTTLHTDMGKLIGTLTYMSPEQVMGDSRALDTRSDIYALGVILYELLSGRPPLDLKNKSIPEAARIIQEETPQRIGSRDGALRGDINAMVCKALEKDRERRYASAAALAEDIRRFLNNEPINARPPTLTYQLSRFVRRNKLFVGLAVLAFLCLFFGLVLAMLSQREEARQRRVAEQKTRQAQRSAYAAKIQAAMAFHVAGDNRAARQQLSAIPGDTGGWEKEYLHCAMEEDILFFPMEVWKRPYWNVNPHGTKALFPVKGVGLRLFDYKTQTYSDHPFSGYEGAVALMPDGQTALWGDHQGRIMVLALKGNGPPKEVLQIPDLIRYIFISPNRRMAAICTVCGEEPFYSNLHLLDLNAFQIIGKTKLGALIDWLCFSPDSLKMALAMHDGPVKVLNADGLTTLQTFTGHSGPAGRVCFSPSGALVASSGVDRTIRIWSMLKGQGIKVLGPSQYWAETLQFLENGHTLLSGHGDARIRTWNIETGVCERMTSDQDSPDPHGSAIQQLSIDKEADLIHAIGLDGVHIRTLGAPLPRIVRHGANLYSYAYGVDFSPDGRRLASAGWDGTVRIIDVAIGRLIAVLKTPESALWAKFSPDGRQLLICSKTGYPDRILSLWNAATLTKEQELKFTQNHDCGFYLPLCNSILIGVGSELWRLDPDSLGVKEKVSVPAEVWALAISPDGKTLACGMIDGRALLLDATRLSPGPGFAAHTAGIQTMTFSPDGKRLASGGEDARIRVWDVKTQKELLCFGNPGAQEHFTLCFTPDNKRILSGSRRVSISIWDAASGLEIVQLHGHKDYVHDLTFNPDGRILASASGDNTTRLWDARPLKDRVEAKRAMLAAEDRVRERVERLVLENKIIEQVLKIIDQDPVLTPLEKHAAWNVIHLNCLR